MKQAIPVIN